MPKTTKTNRSTWDAIDPSLKAQIVDAIGHPIIASTEFISWNRDYVYPGSALQKELMYKPPKDMDIDNRIYKDYIESHKLTPGKTFLVQFAQILGRYFAATATGETVTEVDGTTTTTFAGVTGQDEVFSVLTAAASSTFGPTVGTSSTAVARTDSQLGGKIAHGATASTLQYGASSIGTVSNPSGSISRFQVTRSYTGNAGSTVNVQEDGLEASISSPTGGPYFLLYRNINAFGAVSAAQVVTATVNVDTTS